ncbi:DUF4397 domain-containing protein [Roseateles sp.]|uniref:DUF4397 domain-containing protein n=1 Tax=Roseateles sp. TaxID=1971397 RepID=UPI0032644854
MQFTPWATRLVLTLSLSATALLTACGGKGGDGGNTQVRLLNATQSYATLDLTVKDKTVNSKVAYGTVGDYASVDSGESATRVLAGDAATSIAATTPTLVGGVNYTYIAYGFAGAVRTSLLQEDQAAPDAGKAKLQIVNLALDAGQVDVYLLGPNDAVDTVTASTSGLNGGTGSGYISQNAGTYRLRVTGAAKRSDLRLDVPAITLDSAGVHTLILTSASSGTLVNGIVLTQKGTAKAFANTLARVRAVNALAGAPTVAASVNGITLLPASLPPNVSEYVSLPAGGGNATVTVDGAAIGVTSQTMAAGSDYTLLVSGTAGTAAGVWITDDNRLPTVSGTAKIRLINGLSDPTAVTTLNVDYTAVVSNVLPGTASAAQTINAGTTGSLITVNSPLQLTPLYNPATGISTTGLTQLSSGGVYSVFVLGDPKAATVAGKLAKDR